MLSLTSISSAMGMYLLVPLIPLIGFIALMPLDRARRNDLATLPPIATLIAFVLSLVFAPLGWGLLPDSYSSAVPLVSFALFQLGDAQVALTFGLDRIAVAFVPIVLLVSVAVQGFTLRHLATDRRIGWMMALLSLFTAALVLLMLSCDFISMLASWMAMGFVSVMLGAFWWESRRVARPTMIALAMGLVADVALGAAAVMAFEHAGSMSFDALALSADVPASPLLLASLIVAAIARSSQLPIFFGEFASSTEPLEPAALVNTFGLLSAGSMLLYRTFPLISASPQALGVLLVVGCITAPAAAAVACMASNIRQIFACSTASQAGVILIAFGASSQSIALLHLAANAFFAPLLGLVFSVLVRCTGTRDIRRMGGLASRMPVTAVFATVGALSLVGVIPFAGFLSRDGLVDALVVDGNGIACALVLVTTFLSSIYIGRVLSHAFLGRDSHDAASDPGSLELASLGVLAVGTCVLGIAGFLFPTVFGVTVPRPRPEATLVSALVAVVALWAAWMIFSVDERRRARPLVERIAIVEANRKLKDSLVAVFKSASRAVSALDTRPVVSIACGVVVGLIVIAMAVMF